MQHASAVADPLIAHLAAELADAQRRWRTSRGMGAIASPIIPAALLDEFAAALAPAIRRAAREAAEEVTR